MFRFRLPLSKGTGAVSIPSRFVAHISLAAVTLATCTGAWYAGSWCARASKAERDRVKIASNGLVVEPELIDYGELKQGQMREVTVTIRNRMNTTLVLMRVETSCPCLSVKMERSRLEPGAAIALSTRLDMSRELHFVGRLLLTVGLFDNEGTKVLALFGTANVVKRENHARTFPNLLYVGG